MPRREFSQCRHRAFEDGFTLSDTGERVKGGGGRVELGTSCRCYLLNSETNPFLAKTTLPATFARSSCLCDSEHKLHPYEEERRDSFPGSAGELSCRSIRFVTHIVAVGISGMLFVVLPLGASCFPVSCGAILS